MRTPDVRTASIRASVTLLGVLALVFALLPAAGFAQEADEDRFTCEATLVRIEDNAALGTVAFGEANAENDGDPCQTDDASIIGEIAAGPVTADVLYSRTSDETDEGNAEGHAESGVANVLLELGGNEIQVRLLTAEAQAGPCPSTELSGDATVAGLRINDNNIKVPGSHTHIPLQGEEGGPVGNLHLEHTEVSEDGTTFTSRALWFEDGTGVIGDIVIAEAIADVHGDPCEPTEPPTDRFAGWFTGGGFVAEPGSNRDHNGEGEVNPGTVAHHAFALDCFEEEGVDPRPGKDNLVVQWFDEANNEHASIKLTHIHDTRCYFDGDQGDASPPASEFNTIEGSGVARCRPKVAGIDLPTELQVDVEFRFTDEGEPGIDNDEAHITVDSGMPGICSFTSDGRLDGGNHQAHQLPSQAGGSGGNGGSSANANRF